MRAIPPSMIEELGAWNNGKGIDLEAWISCSGSFRLAVGYAEYFWPEFELIDGYIVRAGITREGLRQWENENSGNRRALEAVINHFHLIDINYHDHEKLSEDLMLRLGTILTQIHEAKLKWQFPDRPCTVSFHIPENRQQYDGYEITFWQKAHEPPKPNEKDGG